MIETSDSDLGLVMNHNYVANALVEASTTTPVSMFLTWTLAPAMVAPERSVTRPLMVPRYSWP
jgi:hypothetical protein